MTNPFTSTVGLKGVTSPAPAVLVNDLPGISTELVGALTTGDNADAATVWAKIQRAGLDKLRNIIELELSKSADFRYISARVGGINGELVAQVLPAAAVYRGVTISAPVDPYSELYVQSISVESLNEEAVQTTLKVFSPLGKELLSKSVTIEPGPNKVTVGYAEESYWGRPVVLFVAVDCTDLSLNMLAYAQDWECGAQTGYLLEPVFSSVVSVQSLANLSGLGQTPVLVEASVRRSLIDVITRYADRLNWAYAHVCGSLLMAEKLGNSSVNLFTNTNRAFTEDREAKFMDEATTLVKPIARDMLKELTVSSAVSPAADRVTDWGYSMDSFV